MDCHERQGIKLFGATIAIQLVGEEEDQIKHEEEGEEELEDGMVTMKSRRSDMENKNRVVAAAAAADKVIACPRCKSMETKFCYFNNYNVNQPRHFCKGCQRYWTAGGALRNVPIGAGRRKLKPHPDSTTGATTTPRSCLPTGFNISDNSCLYVDASTLDFDQDQWRRTMPAPQGAFHHVFPAKRRRSGSDGQNY